MDRIRSAAEKVSGLLDRLAALAIVLTMAVIVANILMRSLFKNPLMGIMDYVMILSAVTVSLALAACAMQNGHIAVDLIIDRLPRRLRSSIDALTNMAALAFWTLAAIFMVRYAQEMAATGTLFPTTRIPFAPVLAVMAAGFFALAAVLLYRVLYIVRKLIA